MIYQYSLTGELINEFNTLAEASETVGIAKTTIWDRIHRTSKITGDFIWKDSSTNYNDKLPKILLFDLESSPLISYHFQMWKVNIGINQVIEKPHLLTWSAKWAFEDVVFSDKLTPDEAVKHDDKRIVESLWEVMDAADIIVGHYSSKFDEPLANSRFVIHGLKPLSPHKTIDTKMVASKYFKMHSNKLDAIADLFGLPGKIDTTFELWKGCMEGDAQSLADMETYNRQDVIVLENVYIRLLPYIKNHPNISLYNNSTETCCTRCGSPDLELLDKKYYTTVSAFVTYRCNECGSISRERRTSISKEKRLNTLTSAQ